MVRVPALAPSGRLLAVASCRGWSRDNACDICVVGLNADWVPEGKPRAVTYQTAAISGLAWTPDGRSLVYSAGVAPNDSSLWRLDVAGGGEPKRLEIASLGAFRPAVALRGNRLAFDRVVSDEDVFRLEVGNTPQPLLVSSMRDLNAQFSPDGRRIAFASGRSGDQVSIWLANADGTGLVQLTRGAGSFEGSPRWSPDGRWIAFDAVSKDGGRHIEVVESSGGRSRQLTDDSFSSKVPSWSRDGKWIYFSSERSGRFEIWRTSAQGGAA